MKTIGTNVSVLYILQAYVINTFDKSESQQLM